MAMTDGKNFSPAVPVIAGLILGAALGFYFGRQNGVQIGAEKAKQEFQAEKTKYQALIDTAFPAPPSEMRTLSGVVKSIAAGKIILEVNDPDDYLPHLDGSPRKKTERTVLADKAEIILTDYTKIDKRGDPETRQIALFDLKPKDTITVRAETDIKKAMKFTAKKIELLKY